MREGDIRPLHEVWDCSWSQKVWKEVIQPQNWQTFVGLQSQAEWVAMNVQKNWGDPDPAGEWRYMFREILYGIWHHHLKTRHEGVHQKIHPSLFLQSMKQRVFVSLKTFFFDVDNSVV